MRKANADVPATPVIQVIERMFALIDVLASREEAISLKEISEKTGLHPSTTHRILNDLAVGRFVDRPEAGSYRLGMRLLELGNLVKARLNVRDAALSPMRELHKLTQQPVNLSMRQGDEIVYIERAYSERSGMQGWRPVRGGDRARDVRRIDVRAPYRRVQDRAGRAGVLLPPARHRPDRLPAEHAAPREPGGTRVAAQPLPGPCGRRAGAPAPCGVAFRARILERTPAASTRVIPRDAFPVSP